MKLYSYSKCGNCRKAIKDLEAKKIKFEVIDITEKPPSKKVLKLAIKEKGLSKVFNTSGVQYRELKIKNKMNKSIIILTLFSPISMCLHSCF